MKTLERVGAVALVWLSLAGCAQSPESSASADRAKDYANRAVAEAGRAVEEQAKAATDATNQKIDSVNQKIDSTGRAVQTSVGDAGITTKVKGLLAADPLVQSFAIDVETLSGVVTLRGEVKNDAQRRRALEDAQAVEGVVQVNDQLTVKS